MSDSPTDAVDFDPRDRNADSKSAPPEGAAAPGDLTLPEALLMLALGDEEGQVNVNKRSALPFGLTAAILLTLAALDRIRHDGDVWAVSSDEPTGDPGLDPALREMAREEEPRGTMHWLRALSGETGEEEELQRRLLKHLTEEGTLREEKHRFLGVIPYHRYPTEDPDPERRVRKRVRQVVLEGEEPDDRVLALIALMDACNLTDEVFTYEERREHADRLDALTKRRRVARAVSAVSEETVAAVLTATNAATTAAKRTF